MGAYPAIEVLEKGLVVPSEETPAEDIWLSNLDLMATRRHTPIVYFYRRPLDDTGFFSPETLKATLARALVPLYPLAGRLVSGADGRLCVRCTAEGVLFVVARSEMAVEDFGDFTPSDEFRRLLVPLVDEDDEADKPLVMFQLTFFRCGGVCLGTAVHHTATDGLGSLYFINYWAKITRTKTDIPILPYLNRTHISARSPPSISYKNDTYSPSSSSPFSTNLPFTSAILKLSNHHISLLKATYTKNNAKLPISTFKAVVTHVWRSACKARGLDLSSPTRIYIATDARSRLRPPIPVGYIGNATFRTSAKLTVKEVLSEFRAVEKIEEMVNALDDEYIRSFIDYLEEKLNTGGVTRKDKWVMAQTDVWVVSWMGLPIYEADFGWGKPFYVGRASFSFGGLVYLLPSSPEEEKRGVSLVMTMEEGKMEKFKEIFYEEIGRDQPAHI